MPRKNQIATASASRNDESAICYGHLGSNRHPRKVPPKLMVRCNKEALTMPGPVSIFVMLHCNRALSPKPV